MTSTLFTSYQSAVKSRLEEMKRTAEAAIGQLDDAALAWAPEPGSNSIAVIVKHMSGHMISRWTDMFTTDGEKPDRNRDAEFIPEKLDRAALLSRWEHGWGLFLKQIGAIREDQLLAEIRIKGQPITVIEAIEKSLYHYAYHTGQIVYIAKQYRKDQWVSLS
ncbi:hypothetical protein FHS19_003406 [Paenibacillus rhizosphaerae]|uniref:DUF1572 domain-containing protein n=1 Tax=Paenibacillus rhizosphaerae TaxID=297318 RepID=A0A839TQ90_9BACL|nr:DUF1572 family protein [Paenibacillus rhizosphaerae]MBB3128731.1 hypothetical protein [Paenibacillus rhizosphaerae]